MENDLCLSEVRLPSSEPWLSQGQGLWFVFPRTGVGEFINGTLRHRLCVQSTLVANVGPAATSIRAANDAFSFRYFHVPLETLFPLLALHDIPRLRAVADGFKTGRSYPAERKPAAQCLALLEHIPAALNLEHRSLLLRIVAMFLDQELQSVSSNQFSAANAGERVQQVLQKLSAEDVINSSVEELAHKFGCSRRHLSRLFKAQFGFSVGALKTEVRLLKAARLLRDPQAKIIHVAAEAGFSHPTRFNSCFRRRFGFSPSQWRKAGLTPSPGPLLSPVPLSLLATNSPAGPQTGQHPAS